MAWAKFILLSLCCLMCSAYNIHESCNDIEEDLKTSVESAMKMAQEASDLLAENNAHAKQLSSYFFSASDLGVVMSVYDNVQNFREFGKEDTDDWVQPTIYCDTARWTKRVEVQEDESAQWVLHHENGAISPYREWYQGCHDTRTTAAFRAGSTDASGKVTMNEITLCPWYLAVLKKSPWKDLEGLPGQAAVKSWDPSRLPSEMDPQADVWATRLDSVLLHEFTHALPDYAYRTTDYAYRWKPCTDAEKRARMCMNADSYAIFAVGSRIIKNFKHTFDKYGNLVYLKKVTARAVQMVSQVWNA
ncbi:hypothetical protein BDV18DRAFT_162174 [Aspergillus unguis]